MLLVRIGHRFEEGEVRGEAGGSILTPPPAFAAGHWQKGIPYPLHAWAAVARHRPVLRLEAAG